MNKNIFLWLRSAIPNNFVGVGNVDYSGFVNSYVVIDCYGVSLACLIG